MAAQFGADALDLLDVEFDQRIAVAREPDRRGEHFRQLLAAVGAHQLAPAREIARRAHREGAALQLVAVAEAIRPEISAGSAL